jgi:hypothetical protein
MAAPARASSNTTVAIINMVVDTPATRSAGTRWLLATKGERRLKIMCRISPERDMGLRAQHARHFVEFVCDNLSYLIMIRNSDHCD